MLEKDPTVPEIMNEIRSGFKPFADSVLKKLDANPVVILTGLSGIGKSSCALPAICDALIARQEVGSVVTATEYRSTAVRIHEASLHSDVIILDEAQVACYSWDQNQREEVVKDLINGGKRIIPLLAYFEFNRFLYEKGGDWPKTIKNTLGFRPKVINITKNHLPTDLAKAYFRANFRDICRTHPLPEGLEAYILQVLPNYLVLLERSSLFLATVVIFHEGKPTLKDYSSYLITVIQGAQNSYIEESEARELKLRVRQDAQENPDLR